MRARPTSRPKQCTGIRIVMLVIGLLGLPLLAPAQETGAKARAVLLIANKHDDTLCFVNPNTLEIIQGSVITVPASLQLPNRSAASSVGWFRKRSFGAGPSSRPRRWIDRIAIRRSGRLRVFGRI